MYQTSNTPFDIVSFYRHTVLAFYVTPSRKREVLVVRLKKSITRLQREKMKKKLDTRKVTNISEK